MKTKIQNHIKTAALIFSASAVFSTAQAGQGPQPSICVRSCWGARAPACSITQMAALTRATIHHTAGVGEYNTTSQAQSAANMRGIQNLHIDRGFCDIAYGFLVDKFGNIFEGRSGSMSSLPRGTHDACNANSFGFTALGYFHPPYNHAFTAAMANGMYDVIAWRMPSSWSPYGAGTYCSRTVGFLDSHRNVSSTACPGDIIHYNYVTANVNGGPFRDNVNARRNGGAKPAEFDPNTATWYLRNSNTTGGIDNQYVFGVAGDIPVMGDWDGNGSITPGVFRPSTARWYLRNSNSNGGVDYILDFGIGSDIPVVGDWDGNGTFTIGVFRPSNAQWFLRNSNSSGASDHIFYFGVPGDRPVVGDWDGNRTSTPGVYRPSTSAWYLSHTFDGALATWFYFGVANDSPITGDWNGDGYWTPGVYRNGIRYLTNSNLNPTTDVIFTYGANSNRHLVWR